MNTKGTVFQPRVLQWKNNMNKIGPIFTQILENFENMTHVCILNKGHGYNYTLHS